MKKIRPIFLFFTGVLLLGSPLGAAVCENDQTIRLGHEAMRVHDYASAAEFYSEALRGKMTAADRADVILLLIDAELSNRNRERARQLLDEWQRVYTERSAGLLPGRLLAAEGRLQEAIQYLEHSVDSAASSADRAEAQLALGAVLLDAGQSTRAIALLKEAVEEPAVPDGCRSQQQLLLVRALLRSGQTAEAQTVLDQSPYRQEFPLDHAKAALRIALQKKDFAAFYKHWQDLPKAPEKDNELAELAIQGACLVSAKDPGDRIDAAAGLMDEAVLRSSPGPAVQSILRRKINQEMQIRPELAVTTISRNLTEFDSEAERRELILTAAELLNRNGHCRDALVWYGKLQDPAVPPLLQWESAKRGAAVARQLQQPREEEELLNNALRQAEQLAASDSRKIGETKVLLGDFYCRCERWAEAEKVLREACDVPGRHLEEGTLLLVQTLVREKKNQEALPLAEKAMKSEQTGYRQRAAYLRALILDRLGRFPDALIACRTLLNESPNAADAPATLFLAAQVEEALLHFEEAARDYSFYADKYRTSADAPAALSGAAHAAILARNAELAQKILALLRERYPNSVVLTETHLQLAADLTAAGRYPEALRELNAVAAVQDKVYRTEYLFRMAEVLRRQGKIQEASKMFREVSRNNPASPFAADAYFQEGDILLEQQNYQEAIQSFEEAGKRYSGGIFPLLCRGRIADSKMLWALSGGDRPRLQKEASAEYEALTKVKTAPAVQLRSLVRLALCARHANDLQLCRQSCWQVLWLAKDMLQHGMMPERAEVSRALDMLLDYARKREKPSKMREYLNFYASMKLESSDDLRDLRRKWLHEEIPTNRSRQ